MAIHQPREYTHCTALHYATALYILTATVDYSALPGAVLLSCCAVLWPHTHARTDMSGVWFVWLTRHATTRHDR